MKKDPLFFLEHILEAIGDIEDFSQNLNRKNLSENRLVQSAIVRQIEIIGEAVKNIPIEFTVNYPQVRWSEIARTRDKLIHHYFGVDLNFVWDIIKVDLPELKKDLEEILEKEKSKAR